MTPGPVEGGDDAVCSAATLPLQLLYGGGDGLVGRLQTVGEEVEPGVTAEHGHVVVRRCCPLVAAGGDRCCHLAGDRAKLDQETAQAAPGESDVQGLVALLTEAQRAARQLSAASAGVEHESAARSRQYQ